MDHVGKLSSLTGDLTFAGDLAFKAELKLIVELTVKRVGTGRTWKLQTVLGGWSLTSKFLQN